MSFPLLKMSPYQIKQRGPLPHQLWLLAEASALSEDFTAYPTSLFHLAPILYLVLSPRAHLNIK